MKSAILRARVDAGKKRDAEDVLRQLGLSLGEAINLFLSQMRRARFKGEWDEITASKLLAAPASQDRHVELGDMQRALLHLPQPQREALILVGAGGFAYEEAAEICQVAVGTIKSRVARGRVALEALLSEGKLPSRRDTPPNPDGKSALDTIMGEVDELSRDRG